MLGGKSLAVKINPEFKNIKISGASVLFIAIFFVYQHCPPSSYSPGCKKFRHITALVQI